jgi:NAD-dependent deacetylase
VNSKIAPALLDALRTAKSVTVLTGAGISAESGVPTFRDALTGLWSKYEPEQLATPAAFRANPKLVWDWYAWRRQQVNSVQPNRGHYALAELERRIRTFTLVTQNVDGLHRRAGSHKVLELHGNIQRVKCLDEGTVVDSWEEREDGPPRCPRCGGLLRPDVVWFGEALPEEIFAEAEKDSQNCDLFLSIGTSSLVYPAAGLPLTAISSGAVVVEINPNATSLTSKAAYAFRAPAGEFLPELVSLL